MAERGRPPKPPEDRKVQRINLRLDSAEKEAFRVAARLSGLGLSAWIRTQLRQAAIKELAADGQPCDFATWRATRRI